MVVAQTHLFRTDHDKQTAVKEKVLSNLDAKTAAAFGRFGTLQDQ
jgi:hypothetical protein